MGRRTLLLIAAVLLAAIGTGVLFLYVRSVAAPPDDGQTTLVLAPAEVIPAGSRITKATAFQRIRVPTETATAAGMLTTSDGIIDKIANRELLPAVPVTAAQFGDKVVSQSRVAVGDAEMALTLEFEDPARVADLLVPGSSVAVWLVDADARPKSIQHQAALLLPQVTVLTIGNRATITSGGPTANQPGGQTRGSSALVTLAVDQTQAGRLLVAQESGRLHLTLLGPKATPTPGTYDERQLGVGGSS